MLSIDFYAFHCFKNLLYLPYTEVLVSKVLKRLILQYIFRVRGNVPLFSDLLSWNRYQTENIRREDSEERQEGRLVHI